MNIERKLHKNPELFREYKSFIDEYIYLGHMRQVNSISWPNYFLPHHCVIKPDSSTTKLRVVFDGSAKTTSGESLNDIMMCGPVVQEDLFSILLRFRTHRYVITADISKMYRQINIDPADHKYQTIVWRDSPTEKLKYYQLSTVTYGTTAAPYLATRSLVQLAVEEETLYPQGALIARRDFYVDDLLTGANSIQEIKQLKLDLIALMEKGGFKLRKWCSNSPELLRDILEDDREKYLQVQDGQAVKTLGLIWQPECDEFQFVSKDMAMPVKCLTKRSVLSDIARFFDPLGLINPIIVLGKIFMQELWQIKLDWNESLPMEYHCKWTKFREQLSLVKDLKFPRKIVSLSNPVQIQIHAFADASERAYGACVYLRCVDSVGNVSINLVTSKSRVAPIKKLTLPRLELCASVLASQLVSRITSVLNMKIHKVICWTDSIIVLSWISELPSHWSTFIGNRVADIQSNSSVDSWRHVQSKDNPADLVSRGLLPAELLKSKLWFHGPAYLLEDENMWLTKVSYDKCKDIPERRKVKSVLLTATEPDLIQSSKFYNSFLKLQNVFCYILRFIKNTQIKAKYTTLPTQQMLTEPHYGPLTVDELENSLRTLIRIVQKTEFYEDYQRLLKKQELSKGSKIRNLCPFLDKEGLIRVGGRLKNADIPFDSKHQFLLPSSHVFVKSLMTYLHNKHKHAGAQTLLTITRQRFWPLRGILIAKKIVHSCIICFKTKPRFIQQIMGDLPKERLQPARPFINCGVDFCGPFLTHYKVRGRSPTKTYIAIFVCFATKAVHLELSSDLSTSSFIAVLKRFVGRRGLVSNLFCDNATNFQGAINELRELYEMFYSQQSKQEIIEMCAQDKINFKFIPPKSPHFGGLWEGAVKSAKHHLRRICQGYSLTYEELNTVVIQIEAILNSRPITPLSADPNDVSVLTPSHFLIGEPLTNIVEPCLKEFPLNRLQRWQYIQRIQQQFWDRWKKDYFNQLQTRVKWQNTQQNVSIGQLVIIKDANLPPIKWMLGRIVELHPGSDGKTRVVLCKTATGLLKRAITNICPLPIDPK